MNHNDVTVMMQSKNHQKNHRKRQHDMTVQKHPGQQRAPYVTKRVLL